ncbi:MAG TPA: CDP-alcohol phosphatidyltransferase family protein [Candidatus Dormibacteraeota bacterium]|nr:CDP-alcohol phosphatidyltransferase family protein [Candidatus Dormibacteraeota bacterium]
MVRRPTERTGPDAEPDLPPNIFVIGLLHDLRNGGYSRQAWAAFWRASWIRSMQIIQMSEELRDSWLRFTLAGVVLILAAAAGVLRYFGLAEAIAFVLTSLVWWGVLMFDLSLHLGLMVNLESGEMLQSLGWPNRLTEIRGFAAVWVAWAAHWASAGAYLPLVSVFGLAAFTDLADGWLARRRHASSRWGRLYDPVIDGIFFSVAAISLAVIDVLPDWLAALVTFRYAFPIVGGLAFLVIRRRTLRVRHTAWGRASSAAIALTVFGAAAATVLHLPFARFGLVFYALVGITALGALITILMKGIEQA